MRNPSIRVTNSSVRTTTLPRRTFKLYGLGIALLFPVVTRIASPLYAQTSPPEPPLNLVINEIYAAPRTGIPEFVELFNAGSAPISIGDLTLEDARRVPGSIVRSEIDTLQPGGYIVLTGNPSLLVAEFGDVRTAEIRPWPALNNGGDLVLLSNASYALDSLRYDAEWIDSGVSIERIDPGIPGFIRSNWRSSLDQRGASPGIVNSVLARDIEAPVVYAAEYIDDKTIEVIFSEWISPGSLDASTILLDDKSVESPIVDGLQDEIQIVAWPRGKVLRIGSVSDYAGNGGGPFSLNVAQRPHRGDLMITEIMFDPGAGSLGKSYPEFVELTNLSLLSLSLSGLGLRIGDPVAPDHLIPLRIVGKVLEPGASAVVYSESATQWLDSPEQNSSLSENFPSVRNVQNLILIPVKGASLGLNNTSDLVAIVDHVNAALDGLTTENRAPDNISLDIELDNVLYATEWHDDRYGSTKGRSLERIHIGPNPDYLSWASSGNPNGANPGYFSGWDAIGVAPYHESLSLSEIMFDPIATASDGRPDQMEYLEIMNTSGEPLDLNGIYLLSGPADNPLSDSIRLAYRSTSLGPGAIALVFNIPDEVEDEDAAPREFLERAFPDEPQTGNGILLPLRSRLGLSNDGERIQLRSPSGEILEDISYTPLWHHFLVIDGKGSSLERLDIQGPANNAGNWTTSVHDSGGTPGAVNSVSITSDSLDIVRVLTVIPRTFSPNGDGIDDVVLLRVNHEAAESAIRVQIFDLNGRLIKRYAERPSLGSETNFYWEGDDNAGRAVPPGIYVVFIQIAGINSRGIDSAKSPVALVR